MGPFEAMEALGANKFRHSGLPVPQILPVYLSHCLYCFEMNVRASAILGYVGAGGLSITINERIGWRDYNSLGTVLLSLFVVVVVIDFFSEYLRKAELKRSGEYGKEDKIAMLERSLDRKLTTLEMYANRPRKWVLYLAITLAIVLLVGWSADDIHFTV